APGRVVGVSGRQAAGRRGRGGRARARDPRGARRDGEGGPAPGDGGLELPGEARAPVVLPLLDRGRAATARGATDRLGAPVRVRSLRFPTRRRDAARSARARLVVDIVLTPPGSAAYDAALPSSHHTNFARGGCRA